MIKIAMVPAFILILTMFAAAEYAGQKEIIFPEIAALALGAWIMEKPPWRSSALTFWLSPTLAALTGTLFVRFFEYSPFFMISGAFCLIVLQLKLLRSSVLPAISAAILAIITRSDSWCYPVSVCVMTGIIAIGRSVSCKDRGALCTKPVPKRMEGNATPCELALWAKLLVGVMLVSGVAVYCDQLFMVAPPLIVAFVELSKSGGTSWETALKILVLLAFAALIGALWYEVAHVIMGLPLWVTAGASTVTVFLAYHVLRLPFPPAVAIALLPTIVPQESLWSYPWQVFGGSTAFVLISRLCFAHGEQPVVVENGSTD